MGSYRPAGVLALLMLVLATAPTACPPPATPLPCRLHELRGVSMSPHRALSTLATVLMVLAAVVPATSASPKNVTISIPAEFSTKLNGTYFKGDNASLFTMWSSPKVSASLRQAIYVWCTCRPQPSIEPWSASRALFQQHYIRVTGLMQSRQDVGVQGILALLWRVPTLPGSSHYGHCDGCRILYRGGKHNLFICQSK